MQLLTPRLRLDPWAEHHAEAFLELSQDDGFHAFPITVYRQGSLEDARAWIRDSQGKLGIWEREGGALVGMGGLTPWTWEGEEMIDLTYRFRRSAWGRGYGTEAAQALIRHGFETLKLREITATITPDNQASIKVATRLGMRLDRRILLKGVETDLYRLEAQPNLR